jgi:hypothetical protein
MWDNNYESINNSGYHAEMGNLKMQLLDAPDVPSRVTRRRLIAVLSIALSVICATLLITSSRQTLVSEKGKMISSPISALNAKTTSSTGILFEYFS